MSEHWHIEFAHLADYAEAPAPAPATVPTEAEVRLAIDAKSEVRIVAYAERLERVFTGGMEMLMGDADGPDGPIGQAVRLLEGMYRQLSAGKDVALIGRAYGAAPSASDQIHGLQDLLVSVVDDANAEAVEKHWNEKNLLGTYQTSERINTGLKGSAYTVREACLLRAIRQGWLRATKVFYSAVVIPVWHEYYWTALDALVSQRSECQRFERQRSCVGTSECQRSEEERKKLGDSWKLIECQRSCVETSECQRFEEERKKLGDSWKLIEFFFEEENDDGGDPVTLFTGLFDFGLAGMALHMLPRAPKAKLEEIVASIITSHGANCEKGCKFIERATGAMKKNMSILDTLSKAASAGSTVIAMWLLTRIPDGAMWQKMAPTLCRAVVATAVAESRRPPQRGGLVAPGLRTDGGAMCRCFANYLRKPPMAAWQAIKARLPDMLEEKRIDIRHIADQLASDLKEYYPSDLKYMLNPPADTLPNDMIVFPERRASRRPADDRSGDAADVLIRIGEVFRPSGTKVIMSPIQRFLKADKSRAIALAVAAWLKKLGRRNTRVEAIARDMVMQWL